jgi:hypothetical protein
LRPRLFLYLRVYVRALRMRICVSAPYTALFSSYFSIYRSVNRHMYGQFAAWHMVFLLYSDIMWDSIKFYIHHHDVLSYNDIYPHYATSIAPGVSKAASRLAESAFICPAPRCIKISACIYLQADCLSKRLFDKRGRGRISPATATPTQFPLKSCGFPGVETAR